MDERIDLTQNRDFRHEREPQFKDAHFFNFKKKPKKSMIPSISSMADAKDFINDSLDSLSSKRIKLRNGELYIEKDYTTPSTKWMCHDDSHIVSCDRCGKKLISLNRVSTLCDRCNDLLDMELNRQLELSNSRRIIDDVIELRPAISIVHSDDELEGANEE